MLKQEDVKEQWGRALRLVVNIFSWLSKRTVYNEIQIDIGVARHAHVLRSHAEVYSLCV